MALGAMAATEVEECGPAPEFDGTLSICLISIECFPGIFRGKLFEQDNWLGALLQADVSPDASEDVWEEGLVGRAVDAAAAAVAIGRLVLRGAPGGRKGSRGSQAPSSSWHAKAAWVAAPAPPPMRFGCTTKVLAKGMLKYDRI